MVHVYSCSNSPESGLGTSHTSLPGADSDPDQYDGNGADGDREFYDNIYETEILPALGTCKALYPFEGTILIKSLLYDVADQHHALRV